MDAPSGSTHARQNMVRTLVASALAALLCLATLWLRVRFSAFVGERPLLIVFMFPILLSALLGGAVPGLVCTVVAVLGTAYWMTSPTGSLSIAAGPDWLQWVFLFAAGALTSALSHGLHLARRREVEYWRRLSDSEHRLRLSERRFETTFEQAGVGMAHVAPDGRWLHVNRELCEMLGYGADELTARTFQDVTHPEDLPEDRNLLRRLLAGEIATSRREKRYVRKDGSTVWGDLSVTRVRGEGGEPDHLVSVIKDVSERKRIAVELDRHRHHLEEVVAERTRELDAVNASLAEQQGLMRTVADTVPGLVGYWGTDLRCRFANATYEAWFGRTAQEMLGLHIRDVIGPEALRGQIRSSRPRCAGRCRASSAACPPATARRGTPC